MEYKVVQTKGKKLKLYVERDGTVVVKAPKWTRKDRIEQFVSRNTDWIEQRRREHRQKAAYGTAPDEKQLKLLKKQAAETMGKKTRFYSEIMGVKADEIKITSAKKRWGSCIRKNGRYTVCYSYRNMFLPDRCQDYIVVHELCHIKQMNHSAAFYAEIEKILPDYRRLEKEIKNRPDLDLYQNSRR